MKKHFSVLFAVLLMASSLSLCSFADTPNQDDNEKMKIVTTIFPEYDWVKNILGDHEADAEVILLLDKGVDLHSYQPSAEDILNISTCDLFVYVGGESDTWVEDTLQQAVNKDMSVINLMAALSDQVKEEELVEGMQEEEHDHDHEEEGNHEDGHDEEEEEPEYDEHVWLSLKNASVLVDCISQAIQKADPGNAEIYESNAAAYIGKLNAVDAEYQAVVDDASVSTLLFGDRFPFRYLADDYGLSYYAAFPGCSAETEADFETIMFLAGKVDELSLHAVLTIEGTDHRIAETIVQNTETKDQEILTMDSMQSTTLEEAESGTTYLSVMDQNLSVLKDALK